jgi:hypothetical protein
MKINDYKNELGNSDLSPKFLIAFFNYTSKYIDCDNLNIEKVLVKQVNDLNQHIIIYLDAFTNENNLKEKYIFDCKCAIDMSCVNIAINKISDIQFENDIAYLNLQKTGEEIVELTKELILFTKTIKDV